MSDPVKAPAMYFNRWARSGWACTQAANRSSPEIKLGRSLGEPSVSVRCLADITSPVSESASAMALHNSSGVTERWSLQKGRQLVASGCLAKKHAKAVGLSANKCKALPPVERKRFHMSSSLSAVARFWTKCEMHHAVPAAQGSPRVRRALANCESDVPRASEVPRLGAAKLFGVNLAAL